MPSSKHLFTGKAGQMAVMAEFLLRGYNVAVPEVDVEDDILVVQDGNIEYARVQVKTTALKQTRNRFANRFEGYWHSFMVIPRPELHLFYEQYELGSRNQSGLLSLYITYSESEAACSGQDLSRFLNNWSDWPLL